MKAVEEDSKRFIKQNRQCFAVPIAGIQAVRRTSRFQTSAYNNVLASRQRDGRKRDEETKTSPESRKAKQTRPGCRSK